MSSTNNRGQGNTLRTPKSVNDTMNTKVQRCWVTPSQPNEAYVDGGEDEKAKVKVGNKKETVGEERKRWEKKKRWERNGGKETFQLLHGTCSLWKKLHTRFWSPSNNFLPSFPSFPRRRPHLSHLLQDSGTGLTWCLPGALNFGVQRVSFTDFGVSNVLGRDCWCSTCNPWTWAKDNTLWVSSFP